LDVFKPRRQLKTAQLFHEKLESFFFLFIIAVVYVESIQALAIWW